MAGEPGTLQSAQNFFARSAEDEDATATTSCLTSETSREEGSIRRSLTKAGGGVEHGNQDSNWEGHLLSAIPPVAVP